MGLSSKPIESQADNYFNEKDVSILISGGVQV
jgi:hypothetical protein